MKENPGFSDATSNLTFGDYLRVLSARRWWLVSIVVIVVTITAIINFKAPNIYRAAATVQINKDNPNVVNVQDVINLPGQGMEFLQTQHKVLRSRTMAERVIKRLSLDKNPAFVGKDQSPDILATGLGFIQKLIQQWMPEGSKEAASTGAPDIVQAYFACVAVTPVRMTLLAEISATLKDKQLVAQIANAHAEEYVKYTLDQRTGVTTEAADWLENQSKDLQAKLAKSEAALQAYREQHGLVSLEERQNIVVEKLKQLNQQVSEAKNQRITAENTYNQLKSMREKGTDPTTLPVVIQNGVIQALKQQMSEKAAALAKLKERYLAKHPQLIQAQSEMEGLQRQVKLEVEKLIATIETDYQLAVSREQNLEVALKEQEKVALALNQKSIGYDALKRQAETDRKLFENVLERMKQTGVSTKLETTNVMILDRAVAPTQKFRPRRSINIIVAFVISLVGGSVFCLMLDSLTETVRAPEDIAEPFGVPFLGYVPHMRGSMLSKGKPFGGSSDGAVAEAFRTVHAVLSLQPESVEARCFLVTSAAPGEGKSTCAANLALTYAQKNFRTLLIEADLRRPSLYVRFDLNSPGGLELFSNGHEDFASMIQPTQVPNLSIVASVASPHNAHFVLASPQVREFILTVKQQFDRIVIDTPPIGAVSDALPLCSQVDGVIWVVRFDTVRKKVVRDAFLRLLQIKSKVLGVLINDVDFSKRHNQYYYSYSGYNAYYGREKKSKQNSANDTTIQS
ncbi:MAG: polysaccharide biosynthesis tyrosine autokinase [Verrucomicrobia bacterium]|nr:polysaccharide biosynthesis tyrosine autokinase [Verrucomicrobiota bacterium]